MVEAEPVTLRTSAAATVPSKFGVVIKFSPRIDHTYPILRVGELAEQVGTIKCRTNFVFSVNPRVEIADEGMWCMKAALRTCLNRFQELALSLDQFALWSRTSSAAGDIQSSEIKR